MDLNPRSIVIDAWTSFSAVTFISASVLMGAANAFFGGLFNNAARRIGGWVANVDWLSRISNGRQPKPKMNGIPELHTSQFWRNCCERSETGKRKVFLTVVLPTGRATQSKVEYLALASDGIAVPEVCLELSHLIKRKSSIKLEVNTVLDIDLIEDAKETKTSLIHKNLLLIGTPDINAVTAQVIAKNDVLGKTGERSGFDRVESTEIRDFEGTIHNGSSQPGYGLVGMYENPWFASEADATPFRRFALVCGGCGAQGTIAATKFLLEMVQNEEKAINNRHRRKLPVRIVQGKIKDYNPVHVDPGEKCIPPIAIGNVTLVEALE